MRPYFSPQPYSWEIDHLMDGRKAKYLMCININTRYLYAIPVLNKTKEESYKAVMKLILYERMCFNHPVKYIRFDGDKGFRAMIPLFKDSDEKITFNSESSPYTNHNRMVDRAIRRIRRLAQFDSWFDGSDDNNPKVQQLTFYINYFLHHGIGRMTPLEMHTDINKEWAYIRSKKELLNKQKLKQIKAGMWNYEPGVTILRMFLNPDKTKNKFDKDRYTFKTYGTFVEYKHGNVVARLKDGRMVEVPIYYTIRDTPNDFIKHPAANTRRHTADKDTTALKDEIEGFEK